MASYANLLGTWYPSTPWVKYGGAWVEPTMGYRRISGIWTPLWEDVPLGLMIGFRSAGAVPTGWTEVTDAYGVELLGASATKPHDTSGGTDVLSLSGVSGLGGGHDGGGAYGGPDPGQAHVVAEPDHQHTLSVSGVAAVKASLTLRILECTGSAQRIPAEGVILHQGTPPFASLTELTASRRFIKAHGTPLTDLVGSTPTAAVGLAGAHSTGAGALSGDPESAYGPIGVGVGGHNHGAGASTTWDIKRYSLSAWYDTGDYQLPSKMIAMFAGTVAPFGWYICDGSNGTPDLRDRFVQVVPATDPVLDTAEGDNAVAIASLASNGTHRHEGPSYNQGLHGSGGGHNYAGAHTHTGLTGAPHQGAYWAYTFIQRSV